LYIYDNVTFGHAKDTQQDCAESKSKRSLPVSPACSVGTTMSLNLTVPKDSPKKVPRRAKSPGKALNLKNKQKAS
jgi:hypothetical protein